MKAAGEKAAEMLPDLSKLTGAPGAAQDLAKSMLPAMRDQMMQMMKGMQEMNRIALDTMQSMFDQNCKMMAQVFDAVEKKGPEEAPAAPEKAEKAPAASEKKAPGAEKKPSAPAKKAPAAEKKPAASAKKAPAKTNKPAKPAAEEEKEEKSEA